MKSDGQRSAVAIMAKAPRPGQVKTRLCPPLSYAEAAELYRCFLLDKIAQVHGLKRATPVISYGPDEENAFDGVKAFFEDIAPSSFALIPQFGDDLGARLLSTFTQLFSQGYRQVMAIDSDTPTLPIAYLERGLDLIAQPETDVVLGPTEDGGYYLIGLRRPYRELFEDMPWSTSRVLPETLRRSAEQGLNVAGLEPWYDIDNPHDLKRLQASLQGSEMGRAQHTRRFLTEYRR
ncbi:MAG: TIGR04282 family arsenosugar biosynthesis glycosyltransferase [Nitrospinae bacterium]|nr:TIGR04282 family arsenosugar biosynthesis glycosyltransferase [Nitrospinota bacterium]